MTDRVSEYRTFRERMNERIREQGNLQINRFFALDGRIYDEGALPVATKELLGLVASLVLRCDDCVSWHILGCRESGLGDDEIFEALSIGLVVGGSITIPHLRRAVDFLDEVNRDEAGGDEVLRDDE
ncbi:MAG: carboxymuconolactone decarboxylase family protein [Longimicrobiales bacterium]|nr:carboxymuconolactone decarboxylase family protein [Longimicrobiales bacterium]